MRHCLLKLGTVFKRHDKKLIQIALVGVHDRVGEQLTDGADSVQKLLLLK